jgi:hypothetical protein
MPTVPDEISVYYHMQVGQIWPFPRAKRQGATFYRPECNVFFFGFKHQLYCITRIASMFRGWTDYGEQDGKMVGKC